MSLRKRQKELFSLSDHKRERGRRKRRGRERNEEKEKERGRRENQEVKGRVLKCLSQI